ncbi:MAG: D-alanyl-D-alanine carboxypeptidase, partial [Novosphingobium sp.]|nr:D-alanyl-D-alanine carboxypeptidase [Novosphingobium sp.]
MLSDPLQPPPEVAGAPVALLVDLGSGRTLFAKNEDRRFLPASVTKVMTSFLAFELLGQHLLVPNQRVTVSDAAFAKWHNVGSRMFLERGQQVSVDELLMGINTVSANDGCVVLAEGALGSVDAWIEAMNAKARELGMRDSHFGTPNGWPDDGATYVTARDLITLGTAMVARHPELYHHYIGHPLFSWNNIAQHNHDPTIEKVPGADGIKTGFTNQAGYNFLGSAVRNGRRLMVVVAQSLRPNDRAKAARALLEWGFAAWDAHRLFGANETVATAQVQGGDARNVPLVAPEPYFATLPHGQSEPIRLRVLYDGPLIAPIRKGTEIARLEIRVGDDPPT